MSISKGCVLINSFKYFTIAVDSFENRLLKGRIFHESIAEGAAFTCLSQMALILEGLFDEIRYPMESVQRRNFDRRITLATPGKVLLESQKAGNDRMGALANFRIQVKFRYYTSWQGSITDLRDGTCVFFASFMELMDYLDGTLGRPGRKKGAGLGGQVCQATNRNYGQYVIGGNVSYPAIENGRIFINEFKLKEELEDIMPPVPEDWKRPIIVPRALQVTAGNIGSVTFAVRVMFRRNGTCQGTICWKEKRSKVSFRSFLEMLLLMHEAMDYEESWNEENNFRAAQLE